MQDAMDLEEVLQELRTKPVVPAYPHGAVVLKMSRNGYYEALGRNEIPEAFKVGRYWKLATAPFRKRLGISEAV